MLLKFRAKAIDVRARNIHLDDQRHMAMAFLNREAEKLPVGFPAPLRLRVALGPFHVGFAPTGHPTHLWSDLDGLSAHR